MKMPTQSNDEIKTILELETAKKGCTQVHLNIHRRPAVYVLWLKEADMFYVGSTANLYKRTAQHIAALRRGNHDNKNFQKAFNSAGDKEIRLSYAWVDHIADGLNREQELLDRYTPTGRLFNLAIDSRHPTRGIKMSDELKEKNRINTTRRWANKDNRTFYLKAQAEGIKETNHDYKGAAKENWKQDEYRSKQLLERASRRNNPKAMEHLKIIGRSVWTNPELKSKMLEIRAKRRRPVIINGVNYDSVGAASKELGIPLVTLRKRLERGYPNHYFTTEKGNT